MIIEEIWRKFVADQLGNSVTMNKLALHVGKVLHLRAGPLFISFRIASDGSLLFVHPAIEADATINFNLAEKDGLSLGSHAEGDSDFLSELGNMKNHTNFAPEQVLEKLCGPMTAQTAQDITRISRGWCKDAGSKLKINLANWLSEESSLFVDQTSMDKHSADLRKLVERTEKLRGRLATTENL